SAAARQTTSQSSLPIISGLTQSNLKANPLSLRVVGALNGLNIRLTNNLHQIANPMIATSIVPFRFVNLQNQTLTSSQPIIIRVMNSLSLTLIKED
ncbi:unnamed protein product, partial [Didymodactylos carnosus]